MTRVLNFLEQKDKKYIDNVGHIIVGSVAYTCLCIQVCATKLQLTWHAKYYHVNKTFIRIKCTLDG